VLLNSHKRFNKIDKKLTETKEKTDFNIIL